MKKAFKYGLLLLIAAIMVSCKSYNDYKNVAWQEEEKPDWENPEVFEINREAPRANYIPFASVDEVDRDNKWASSLIQSLNGEWQFHISKTPASGHFICYF